MSISQLEAEELIEKALCLVSYHKTLLECSGLHLIHNKRHDPQFCGFAFISMDDEQDAEDAIRALDQKEFGRQGRRLRVDWTKQERGGRRSGGSRSSGISKPTKTLFVINFDPMQTRTSDLEKHFDPYGKILSIRIRRNFAFIQYELQEDATKALDATNMSKLMDQVVSVEYAVRDDDGRRNRNSPDQRDRGRSPDRSRDRRRSPSPPRRQRDSPDYGHGPSERSRGRIRVASPQGRNRDSPDYGGHISPNTKREQRGNIYPRERESPDSGLAPRGRPYGRDRVSPNYDGPSSPNTKPEHRGNLSRQGRDSPDPDRGPSPKRKPERSPPPRQERDSPDRARSASPYTKPGTRHNSNQQDRDGPDIGHCSSPNTKYESRVVTKDTEHGVVTTENDPNLGPVASPRRSKGKPSGSSKHARTRDPVDEKKHRSRSPSARKTLREAEKKQKRESTDV